MEYRAPAAACAADVLQLLARSEQPQTTADIARAVGSSRSLVFRVLKELERTELVERVDPYRYWLGVAALEVGGAFLASADFDHVAHHAMQDLARQTGEIVNLGTLRGASVVYVMKEEGSRAIVTLSHVGKALPANCSALGKVLLAALSDEEVERRLGPGPLPHLTDRSITEPALLEAELTRVRSQGYATETGESVAHRGCIAVPVRVPGFEQRLMALSISSSEHDFEERREEFVAALLASKRRLDRGAESERALRRAAGGADDPRERD
ncbi:MAG: IclR family transcriptional regulator [Candidatus Dormiibacterota bacterium]